jgi:hypothetical protein
MGVVRYGYRSDSAQGTWLADLPDHPEGGDRGRAAVLAEARHGVRFVSGIAAFLVWIWGFGLLDIEKHRRKQALQQRKMRDELGVHWRLRGDWVWRRRSAKRCGTATARRNRSWRTARVV